MRLIVIFASMMLLALAGCGEEEEAAPFVLPPPTPAVYDDTSAPRAALPEGTTLADADALTAPLALEGSDTGEEGIFYAAALGGYYLIRVQQADGSFGYQYNFKEDAWADDNSVYRQAGTTYTQAWLATLTGRVEFSISTEWALRWLTAQMTSDGAGGMKLLDIGGTGLVLLSLTEHAAYTGDTSRDDLIRASGEYLLARVAEDGRFTESVPLQWGQAMQALWRLYVYLGDVRYLDALERAGRYIYDHPEVQGEEEEGYILTLWINEPLTDLYSVRPSPWITELVFGLTDYIVAHQYTADNTDERAWVGSYIMPESGNKGTWRTALRLEGVIDAVRLAQLSGDEERLARYTESTLLAVYYLQSIQLRTGRTRGAKRPELVEGAFPFSGTDSTLRIDVTHHTANTLIKVVKYLDLEDYPGEVAQ